MAHSSIIDWKIPWTGIWWATVLGGHKKSDTTEHTIAYMC